MEIKSKTKTPIIKWGCMDAKFHRRNENISEKMKTTNQFWMGNKSKMINK